MDQTPKPLTELSGILYSKLFPNPAEPGRGSFVAEQVEITREHVRWSVIAPVPWVPKVLSSARRPYVAGTGEYHGVPVARPRYAVLPARVAYGTVGAAMARSSRVPFENALSAGAGFVHAHTLYPAGEAALICAARRLPVIVTVHGSDLRSNLVRSDWRSRIARVARDAAAVVCVSRSLAAEVVAELSVDPSRVLVIPNSFDDELFCTTERPIRTGALRLVSVGNLVPVKGTDVLLEALARARATGLDAELTILGDGVERAALEQRARQADLSGSVRFAGHAGHSDVVETLREADLFVMPSRHEGFGVALVEALASGLPAVVTASGGPEEILAGSTVTGAGSGVIARPGDAEDLARALREAVGILGEFDREAISRDARARFGRAGVAARLVRLYGEVVSGSPLTGTYAEETAR